MKKKLDRIPEYLEFPSVEIKRLKTKKNSICVGMHCEVKEPREVALGYGIGALPKARGLQVNKKGARVFHDKGVIDLNDLERRIKNIEKIQAIQIGKQVRLAISKK